MATMESLGEKLDKTLLSFFDTLSQLYQEQAKVEQYMRDGFINLSRARYSMGSKAVSALQLPEKKMTASLTIDITGQGKDLQYNYHQQDFEVKSVQKRNKKNESDTSAISEALDVNKDDDSMIADPLKWFGVLVPQALRRSQKSFQEATKLAINVANLKNDLHVLRLEYKSLQDQKQKLLSSN